MGKFTSEGVGSSSMMVKVGNGGFRRSSTRRLISMDIETRWNTIKMTVQMRSRRTIDPIKIVIWWE